MAKAVHLCLILILAAQVILTTQDKDASDSQSEGEGPKKCYKYKRCVTIFRELFAGTKKETGCVAEEICDAWECERPEPMRRKREAGSQSDSCDLSTRELLDVLLAKCDHSDPATGCVKEVLKNCEHCEAIEELTEASGCKLDCITAWGWVEWVILVAGILGGILVIGIIACIVSKVCKTGACASGA